MDLELGNCSRCGGKMEQKCVDHDIGALIGLESVVVHNLPAPVCADCGSVVVSGGILEPIGVIIATEMLKQSRLDASEVRYLRKLIGDTQEKFAVGLGTTRVTVTRWEEANKVNDGTTSYSIRSYVYFRLREQGVPASIGYLAQVEPYFVLKQPLKESHLRVRDVDYAKILGSLTGTGTIELR